MDEIRVKIQEYSDNYPVLLPVICIAAGVFLLLSCIFDWNFIFGDISTANYSFFKIDGLVNIFGRKKARVIVGCVSVFVIGIGVATFYVLA
ncbi:Imm17 family immunity protein [Dysgonomonas sp. 511]|uniref:Imm17 family immunity protein n=1 Tax=Dysgonomonas sp. 511 TaxID=2302930 RepID=UPI0013D5BA5D|nr:Imm17 family immunity protein [Dysgonomonas sp. 511]NDV79048.1 hypothetical protein [Dysgonomonas sp. 511]